MGLFSNWFNKSNNGSKAASSKPYEIHSASSARTPVKARNYNLLDLICGKYKEYQNINSMIEKLAEVLKKGNYAGDLDEARKRLEKITDKYAGVNSERNELRRNLVSLETLIGIRKRYDNLDIYDKEVMHEGFIHYLRRYSQDEDSKLEDNYKTENIFVTEEGRLDFSSLRKFRLWNSAYKLEMAVVS